MDFPHWSENMKRQCVLMLNMNSGILLIGEWSLSFHGSYFMTNKNLKSNSY